MDWGHGFAGNGCHRAITVTGAHDVSTGRHHEAVDDRYHLSDFGCALLRGPRAAQEPARLGSSQDPGADHGRIRKPAHDGRPGARPEELDHGIEDADRYRRKSL